MTEMLVRELASSSDVRALSIRQPWADAILYGGKRIENRACWRTSHFRGPCLLHAAKGMTRPEYDDVLRFLDKQRIEWRPKPFAEIVRGGLVGVARVGGVVQSIGDGGYRLTAGRETSLMFTEQMDAWWMGYFALLLADVEARPFVAHPGALGFFRVPTAVVSRFLQGGA